VDFKSALPAFACKGNLLGRGRGHPRAGVGRELSERERELARKVGVTHPSEFASSPSRHYGQPQEQTGLMDPGMVALLLDTQCLSVTSRDVRLLSHEFRHVYQYEQAGSVAAFLLGISCRSSSAATHRQTFEIDARAP